MGGRSSSSGLASTPAAAPSPAPAPAPQTQPAPAPQTQPAPAAQTAPAPAQQAAVQGRTITRADVAALQRTMGQTGYEAGDPNAAPQNKVYVKTSKSFNINAYLRSDRQTVHDATGNSQWEHLGYTTRDAARAVSQIDAGMKPLPYNIALTRFVGGGALGAILGNPAITSQNVGRIISSIKTPAGAAKFAAALAQASYTEKAYTSTTYLQTHPAFDTRQIRFNIIARKGTKAIATSNHAENEILLGRGVKYNFTGGFRVVTTPKGVEQLIIDVVI